MTCRLIIQRLVQEIVLLVLHRCPIINRILHVRLWIRILIFSCSCRYREGVRYRFEHSKIKFVSTCGHVISSLTISSSVRTDQASISLHVQACVLAKAGDEAFVSIVGVNCTYIFSTFPSLRSDLKWTLTRRGRKKTTTKAVFLNACVF